MWIEIGGAARVSVGYAVTPLAGVWIEMLPTPPIWSKTSVTPLAGVWIEIRQKAAYDVEKVSHSPCGRVD